MGYVMLQIEVSCHQSIAERDQGEAEVLARRFLVLLRSFLTGQALKASTAGDRMGGAVEARPDDVDDRDDACSPIVRAFGPDWRWKFMLIIVSALVAVLLLIWLAKRGVMTWWCRRRRVPPQPQPSMPMCTVCQDHCWRMAY
ncbi:hypothetical protein PVAP13_4KG111676 [Panicum virgatum]|uniref:Uncharacterized protein n=1 Tax=Panicum virgatum TaxID=38727 RepID=A0A8T0TMH6_PANVG|nr:hypothetical protein PVAP13_4KG111676 [Panicum virgatum]